VEELMRLESPVQYVSLTPRRDLEVGDKTLPAGDLVLACIGAANRDPAVFADPDTIVPARSPNPHLALGHGPFFCIGGALARMQARAALSALLRVVPGLRLAPVPPQWREAPPVLRGLRELGVLALAAPWPRREAV
jgi:cytochrome P450